MELLDKLKKAAGLLVYSLCPSRCAFCDGIVKYGAVLCDACAEEIKFTKNICPKCSKNSCICGESKFVFDKTIAPFYYKDEVRDAIVRMKSLNTPENAKVFAYYIAEFYLKAQDMPEADYITYIPVTRRRKLERGYNQSKLIAEYLSDYTGIPCKELIVKLKQTHDQRGLSGKERRKNLKGAFKITGFENIKSKNIILCDDVFTTGSTLNEASKILKRAGAGKIICCVAATTYSQI